MAGNDYWDDYIDAAIDTKKTPPPPTNGATIPDTGHPLVTTALRYRLDELKAMPPNSGRNSALNIAAAYLGRFPIPRPQLRDLLLNACHTNGLLAEDGERQCDNTISSGFKKADADGPRTITDPTDIPPAYTMDAPESEQQDLHQIAVARRAYEYRVNDEARALYASHQAAALGQHAPNPISLTDFLAVPDEDAVYRITDLLPVGGRALLAAQYKAGKTTMMANLLRSLADGTPFLGRYNTTPAQRIALIDTELDERMLRRWLRTQGIRNTDNIVIVSLRGKLSTFDITSDRVRADWAERLAGCDVIILDCLRPCLDALGLSEDKDAGKFLVCFDALLGESGANESTVVHHMGHSEERSRGDSRLLDWPDVLWKIVRENGDDEESSDRYFSAMGRDVNIPESLLDYNPDAGSYMICGGGRTEKKARGIIEDIIEILSLPDIPDNGLSRNALLSALVNEGHPQQASKKAIKLAAEDNIVIINPGPNRTQWHILNPSERRPS